MPACMLDTRAPTGQQRVVDIDADRFQHHAGTGKEQVPAHQATRVVEGQGVLWSLHPAIERAAREAAERAPGDLWSFTPGQDIQGMLHERMDARLFRS